MTFARAAALSAAVLTGVLSGAAPALAAEPTIVELTVVGGPGLNPNADGRASPIVVRIFELAATTRFEAADYVALFERPGADLKREVVAQNEFVLRPGGIEEQNRTLQPQVQMLGIAAAFRDLDHAQWRLTIPVTPGRRNFVLVHLERNSIRIVPAEPGRP